MQVYVDGVLFLNFFFDYLLITSTSIVLKRNASMFRLILSAFIGSLSTLLLFFKINSIELFILKIVLAIIMVITAFKFKNIKYFLEGVATFYLLSIILGGFLYYLNIELSYKQSGLVFYHKGISINIVLIIIATPVILYLYIKELKKYKNKINSYYPVNLYIDDNKLKLNGFFDTGNSLTYKGRPVVITNLKNKYKKETYLVPYNTVSGTGLLTCIKVKKIEIKNLGVFKNIYLGFSSSMNIAGADILLNGKMEETCLKN